jgi:hypothetical protein
MNNQENKKIICYKDAKTWKFVSMSWKDFIIFKTKKEAEKEALKRLSKK